MKKIVFIALIAVLGYASESNAITISDLKEATYKLILEVKHLRSIQQKDKDAMLEKLEQIKRLLESNIKANEEKIASLKKEIDNIRSSLNLSSNDAYDRFIKRYVQKNSGYLRGMEK